MADPSSPVSMTNVPKLKEKARTMEHRGQWREALGALREVVATAEGEELEVGLWNRIGDLHVRLGETEHAVDAYEQAADAYAEAGLHNNAIALCKKILRIVPGRVAVYQKLGRISAAKGFLADARHNFLEYAERMQRAGQIDASFDALKEFASLSPDDAELRRLLADQFRSHGRDSEAVEQLIQLRALLLRDGSGAEAEQVRQEIRLLDPAANPDQDITGAAVADEELAAEDDGMVLHFTELSLDQDPAADPLRGLEATGMEAENQSLDEIAAMDGLETTGTFDDDGLGSEAELASLVDVSADDDDDHEPAAPLPTLELLPFDGETDHASSGEADESEPLPLLDFDSGCQGTVDEEETGPELPLLDFGDDREPQEDPVDAANRLVEANPADGGARADLRALLRDRGREANLVPVLERTVETLAARGAYVDALEAVGELLVFRPGDLALLQAQVEYASRIGTRDTLIRTHLEFARALASRGEAAKSRAVFQQVLRIDPANAEARAALPPPPPPPPPPSDYIDLRALLDEDEPQQKTTRFTVDVEPPSGDEDADFADLLSAFKQKVAEHIDPEDSASHYDLGVAFMEMGLIDDAIGQFQVALRGGANPLATLELLGKCFAEKGQPAVAAKVLERATRLPSSSDADLIGVLYELARAEEATGNRRAALDRLERVLAVDIRFRDAAERAAALRRAVTL